MSASKRCWLQTVARVAVLAATSVLGGCFSMSAVAPSGSLAKVEIGESIPAQSFLPGEPAEVESDWGDDGEFVLLHPMINGRDVGWFIFDTGASGCTITASAAKRAGLSPIGCTRLQGETLTTVYRCPTLQCGPLTLSDLNVTGLNMSRASSAFGRPVVGILGRDICRSAVVELDGYARAVRLHDPVAFDASSRAKGLAWHGISLDRQLPHITCAYGGPAQGPPIAEGRFVLDTGANATIHFFAGAVERSDLTHSPGVTLTGTKTQITFGTIGRIDEGTVQGFWFGGSDTAPMGPVAATFARAGDTPSQTLKDADGLVGMGFLRGHVVYLDESRSRVAITDRDAK